MNTYRAWDDKAQKFRNDVVSSPSGGVFNKKKWSIHFCR